MKRLCLALLALLCPLSLGAQTELDSLTARAVQQALLGNSDAVAEMAQSRNAQEKALQDEGINPTRLSDNLALLAAAASPNPPARKEVPRLIERFREDQETERLLGLYEQVVPRDRFTRARVNRQYERARNQVNSITQGLFSVIQLQLFGLVQPPLDFAEWLTLKRQFLTPEQRREYVQARDFLRSEEAPTPGDTLVEKAEKVVDSYPERRTRTNAHQARQNGLRSLKRNQQDSALWWFSREAQLRSSIEDTKNPSAETFQKLQQQSAAEEEGRNRSLTLGGDAERSYNQDSWNAYHALLRVAVEGIPTGTLSPADQELVQLRLPAEWAVLKAAEQRRTNHPESRATLVEWSNSAEDSFWQRRVQGYLQRVDFNPRLDFSRADADYRRQVRRYIVYAESPLNPGQHLSAEEARQQRGGWIRTVRQLFVFDMLARSLVLPLLPGNTFSRESTLDAYGRLHATERDTELGRRAEEKALRAFGKMKRFESAVQLAERLGETGTLKRRSRNWAKAEITRLEAFTEEQRLTKLEAVQQRIPTEEAKKILSDAVADERARQDVEVVVDRKFIRRNPAIWEQSQMFLPAEWTDGTKKNGEVGQEGLYLLSGDRVRFKSRHNKEWLTFDVTAGSVEKATTLILPLRRAEVAEEFLNQPRERKRVPIQVEGSAFPGVNMMPGLVPLDPSPLNRRYYN